MGHNPKTCESCYMSRIAEFVHLNGAMIQARGLHLMKSNRKDDRLLGSAIYLALFAAKVIRKQPACTSFVSIPIEAMDLASTSPIDLAAQIVEKLTGKRQTDSLEARKN